ncbi:MAG: type II toxin-antitoxin system HicB family antitoxin [Candidatus Diapherotrites archaeon]|nr:type II toxin-antitoxin system HicB family antitoxin [Candidatus Diapherotrites archaeon]
MKLHVVLEAQPEGGYTVYIPELPGCISQGETRKEALKNIWEARELYLEELSKTQLQQVSKRVQILETVV